MLFEQNFGRSTYHVQKYHLPESFTFTWHKWMVLIFLSRHVSTSNVLFTYLFTLRSAHQVGMGSDVTVCSVNKFCV